MPMLSRLSRRGCLALAGASLACVLDARHAEAAVFRALSLQSLLRASHNVSAVTVLLAECHYVTMGSSRRIVTDTRVQIESALGRGSAGDAEVLVRTLGGVVGERGELVDGQAVLGTGERAVLFLGRSVPGLYFVVGMAQGHYPIRRGEDGTSRLASSPRLPKLLQTSGVGAAELLVGRSVDHARRVIRGAEQ